MENYTIINSENESEDMPHYTREFNILHEDDLPVKRREGKSKNLNVPHEVPNLHRQQSQSESRRIPIASPALGLPELPHISMPSQDSPLIQTILSLIHTVAAIFALYLSFHCNRGFNVGSFLAAGICPYVYILYAFAVFPDLCGLAA
jgi:hypothetical protein